MFFMRSIILTRNFLRSTRVFKVPRTLVIVKCTGLVENFHLHYDSQVPADKSSHSPGYSCSCRCRMPGCRVEWAAVAGLCLVAVEPRIITKLLLVVLVI